MNLLPVSHQQQKHQSDCLAACAAMILNYLQIPIGYERLMQLLKVDAIGTPFRNLQNLSSLGLSILIEEGDLATVQTHLEAGLPVITAVDTRQLSYWQEETDHAVVIVGLDDTSVYLHDPDFAGFPQVVSRAEFELSWLEKNYLYAVIQLV
ncbi:MAG: peptidase C39 family protein [Anaerolineae bacterium]|nr:peptidase C39 family protein [Anaerolineae bacterium]